MIFFYSTTNKHACSLLPVRLLSERLRCSRLERLPSSAGMHPAHEAMTGVVNRKPLRQSIQYVGGRHALARNRRETSSAKNISPIISSLSPLSWVLYSTRTFSFLRARKASGIGPETKMEKKQHHETGLRHLARAQFSSVKQVIKISLFSPFTRNWFGDSFINPIGSSAMLCLHRPGL